jgi:hypothetical protein
MFSFLGFRKMGDEGEIKIQSPVFTSFMPALDLTNASDLNRKRE